MIYFLDCEFIEGFHKPTFGNRRHFIDLISIGIVSSDGREYYAISNEFNPKDASPWVKDNVISKLTAGTKITYNSTDSSGTMQVGDVKSPAFTGMEAVKKIGKSNKQIAKEIIDFVYPIIPSLTSDNIDHAEAVGYGKLLASVNTQPTFYGYYADYDWVLFCSLFGTMMDLPTGFPKYMRDLKQMVDEWAEKAMPTFQSLLGGVPVTFDRALQELKNDANYPKETNEHNALADARWNRDLYKFLTT